MKMRPTIRSATLVAAVAILAGCGGLSPTLAPSPGVTSASDPSPPTAAAPTATPSPTPSVPSTFPVAVVTGITNLKSAVSLEELATLAGNDELAVPCGVQVERPTLTTTAPCLAADEIAAMLATDQTRVALLPPGLVEPATKVLRIAGDGPFGLYGPDLFGDPEARAMTYPVVGRAMPDDPTLDPAWIDHDPSEIWTLTSIGSLCSDRAGAYQAVTLGKGWDWVFTGGTAEYAGPAVVDPPEEGPYIPVQPVDTGNDGAFPSILERSDVAFADHECPVMRSESWRPQLGSALVFSVPEDVLPLWRDTLGLDAVYLAANHMSDLGVDGIRSTLQLLEEYGIPQTGLGMDLDQALEPAYVEVAGLTVAFVAHNDVPGVAEATADRAGVPWITEENVNESVRRARAGGADLVICAPQWWGGAEYHHDLWPLQVTQLEWFDGAGCDHVIGAGTHVAGPLLLRTRPEGGASLVLASPGNHFFGQDWWQATQEGVILDMTFRGTTLVNVRMHPTVMILAARPALLDPEGDGRYVLQRIWQRAEGDLLP